MTTTHTSRVPPIWKSLQRRRITQISKIKAMGSHHWPCARCTKNSWLQDIPSSWRTTKKSRQVLRQTSGEGIHLCIKLTLCLTIFLYQEKEWWTVTCSRLQEAQQVYHMEYLSTPTDQGTELQSSKENLVHQVQCLLGIQQHMHQERRQMESRIQNKQRNLCSHCNVFRTN